MGPGADVKVVERVCSLMEEVEKTVGLENPLKELEDRVAADNRSTGIDLEHAQ